MQNNPHRPTTSANDAYGPAGADLEAISALVDGELAAHQWDSALEAAVHDPAGREAWQRYQRLGELLRATDLIAEKRHSTLALGSFVSKVMEKVAAEPLAAPLAIAAGQVRAAARAPAANDAWGWKLAAGFASLAAVVAVAWNFVATPQPGGQLAGAPTPPTAQTAQTAEAVMIRDPRLDELLAAHRQLGGGSALQAPAGVLRNATFEVPGR